MLNKLELVSFTSSFERKLSIFYTLDEKEQPVACCIRVLHLNLATGSTNVVYEKQLFFHLEMKSTHFCYRKCLAFVRLKYTDVAEDEGRETSGA